MSQEGQHTDTQRTMDTFAYSDAEIADVIAQADTTLSFFGTSSDKEFYNQLHNLSRKELNLTSHSSTLVEYIKTKRIPRGLRVNLTPLGCINNKDFLAKWEGIWNKASLDAMVLTVEYLQPEIVKTKQEIATLKDSLKQSVQNQAEYERIIKDIHTSIERLKRDTVARKLKKFQRDTRDYTSGIVYSWQGGSPRQQTRSNNFGLPRHRPEAGAPQQLYTRRTPPPPGSTDSVSDERFSSESERGTQGYRGSQRPFLGEQRKQNRREPDWRGTRGAHEESVAGGYLPRKSKHRPVQRQFYQSY
ncbi:uncharacterized protein LOC121396365 [Xenopus laevis]|uniref:Uncharacterized protein LOC121396365 n=1 Tax=Xenopus laevis TaxID=8355 RepID=A0A8J1LCE0_XENLA|nr:uncharacterized protein LOC121396365 [Xenopus laevis]